MCPDFSEHSVHVWRIELEAEAESLDAGFAVLDASERERALRYAFDRDRRRFVMRHAAVRRIVGHYLDQPPQTLQFAVGGYGRPRVIGTTFDFNLSHSHELALLAVSETNRVGIDVEHLVARHANPHLLEPYIQQDLLSEFFELRSTARVHAFYTWWTRIEAVAKARGTGIAENPPPRLGSSPETVLAQALPDAEGKVRRWHLISLPMTEDYIATLAVADLAPKLAVYEWSESHSYCN